MKKLLAILSTASVAALSGWAAIDWNSVEDLTPAEGASVVVSSNPNDAATIIDNNNGTTWQAVGGANNYEGHNDWALIDLGSEQTFTDIEIMWEASHPLTYDIYVSTTEIEYEAKEYGNNAQSLNDIKAAWLATATPAASVELTGESGVTEVTTFDAAQTGRYILIYCRTYNDFATTWGSRIYEVRIADIEGRDEISAISVTGASVTEGETATVAVDVYNTIGEKVGVDNVSDITLTADSEAVEITAGENGSFSVKCDVMGKYTLTATAKAGENTLTASSQLVVGKDWSQEGASIITSEMLTYVRVKTADDAEKLNADGKNATDGNEETYYEYNGDYAGGEAYVIVDLGRNYVINTVGAHFNVGGTYKIIYAADGATAPADSENAWVKPEDWNETAMLSRTDGDYAFEAPITARYIGVADGSNPGKPRLNELYVAGEEKFEAVLTTIKLTASNDVVLAADDAVVNFTVEAFDQYGAAFEGADFTIMNGDTALEGTTFAATTAGEYTFRAVSGDVESDEVTVTVKTVANPEVNVADPVIKLGGEECTANPLNNAQVDFGSNGAGLNKALEITLDGNYNLDVILLKWEGACPSKYTVAVSTEDNGEAVVVYTHDSERLKTPGAAFYDYIWAKPAAQNSMRKAVAVHAQANHDLKGVKKIIVTPTAEANETAWGIKLNGMALYGVKDGQTLNVTAVNTAEEALVDVYTLSGVKVRGGVSAANALEGLPAGFYVAGGKKVVKK